MFFFVCLFVSFLICCNQRPKPKPEEQLDLLAKVKGTLVPMQFRFLEQDLEKMWKPHSIRDIRIIPDDILTPIVADQMRPKTTSEPAFSSQIDEEVKTDVISHTTHFMYNLQLLYYMHGAFELIIATSTVILDYLLCSCLVILISFIKTMHVFNRYVTGCIAKRLLENQYSNTSQRTGVLPVTEL